MSSWFEVSKNENGKFSFALKDDSGETLLVSSKPYFSKGSAMSDIDAIRDNCAYEYFYERQESNGEHFFNLQAKNHAVLGTSQKFSSAQLLENAIASAKAQGTTRDVKASA